MEEDNDGAIESAQVRPQQNTEVESEIVIQIKSNGDVYIKSFLSDKPNISSLCMIIKSPNKLQETVKMSIFNALMVKGKIEDIKKIKQKIAEPLISPTEVFGGKR